MKLRLASWNINSVRARLAHVQRFLREESPDILCLQETKVACESFPKAEIESLGYPYIYTCGQPAYHGVAIISRVPLSDIVRHDWHVKGEARHIGGVLPIGAGSSAVRLECVYIPAGGDVPDRTENRKFGEKLDFLDAMVDWSAQLCQPTILVGDFNIAPLECDVWNHKALLNVVSHTPIEVAQLARLQQAADWVDLGRHFISAPQRLYSWWSYRAYDWRASDRGRRLDHMWVTPDLQSTARSHRVYEDCRSWEYCRNWQSCAAWRAQRGWGDGRSQTACETHDHSSDWQRCKKCEKPSDHIPLVTEFVFA